MARVVVYQNTKKCRVLSSRSETTCRRWRSRMCRLGIHPTGDGLLCNDRIPTCT